MYAWVPLLFWDTWNYLNIVNQLYANIKLKDFFVLFFKGKVRVCDQLVDIFLIGWRQGNKVVFREFQLSVFWIQSIWRVCASGQYAVLPGGGFSICKTAKDLAQDIIYCPWGGTKSPWLYFMAKLLFFCLSWVFSFVPAFSHHSDSICSLELQGRLGG